MKFQGINYDGQEQLPARDILPEGVRSGGVEQEIGIIRSELHCNAIRIPASISTPRDSF
jgi:hypothetical protein